MTDRKLKQEAEAFDQQIIERVRHGHLPDLRRSGRCEYFFNNVWRDQEFAALYFGEIVQKVLAARVAHLPGKAPGETTLLEVGCGPGQVSLELARNGLNVTGLDLSAACIDVATKVAAEDPWAGERGELQYEAADFFAYDQPCDIVLFAASLHHFPDCRQPVAHAARAKSTSLTLQYKDFGLGSPASITLRNDRGKAHFAPGGDSDHGPISVAAAGTFTIRLCRLTVISLPSLRYECLGMSVYPLRALTTFLRLWPLTGCSATRSVCPGSSPNSCLAA